MKFDISKGLPPPGVVNRNSFWLGGMGWCAAIMNGNVLSGVHRQVLLTTIGWFLGYHLTKYENYVHAKLDREMNEYMKLHPDDFAPKEKKTFAEIVEPFIPVR
uniref:NADH dehydrogenase [ubiquinone] 1 subunit C2 n=1 Tax=Hippocampus comes TaxID=109280 RepID=A0A3Q2Y5T2_HIPCM